MRLQEQFKKEIGPRLAKERYGNIHAVPRIEKVVINVGIGRNGREEKFRNAVITTVERISGQKPVITAAKKSISAFKVREGMPVGVMVTLRGKRMWDFVEKLVRVVFPRVRDFRGLDVKNIDRNGNASFGFREHLVFPEIRPDEIELIHGVEVTVKTTAKTQDEGVTLLKTLGFPFKKDN